MQVAVNCREPRVPALSPTIIPEQVKFAAAQKALDEDRLINKPHCMWLLLQKRAVGHRRSRNVMVSLAKAKPNWLVMLAYISMSTRFSCFVFGITGAPLIKKLT
jgi:hypothetical protein